MRAVAGEAQPAPRTWYGGPMLAADGASLAVFWTGVALAARAARTGGSQGGGDLLASVGAGGFVLGAPVVHAIHGRRGVAVTSFGLRLLMPATASYLAFVLTGYRCIGAAFANMPCGNTAPGLVAPPAATMVLVALIDDLLLARELAPVSAPRATAVRIEPHVVVGRVTTIGVAGEF